MGVKRIAGTFGVGGEQRAREGDELALAGGLVGARRLNHRVEQRGHVGFWKQGRR